MRFKDKHDFISTVEAEYARFNGLVAQLCDANSTMKGLWGKGWSAKDMLAHIHEWHLMMLGWHKQGLKTGKAYMPAKGYKWSETPELNESIYEKNKDIPLTDAKKKLRASHNRVMKLVESLTEKELLNAGAFEWCGKNPITTYLAGAVISHYRWGQKKLKPFLKRV